MNNKHLLLGRLAEAYAEKYLIEKGLTLVCKNYRCYSGEIDLIMRDNQTIIFVEVRYRSHSSHGDALASVTQAKQGKLLRAALHFLQKSNLLYKSFSRFDIIAIDRQSDSYSCHWLKNAFTVNH